MRETGYMGNPANIVRVRFLLDWRNCSVGSVGAVDVVDAVGKPINPIRGGIDFGWGVPCPQSRDRGARATIRQPGLTNIQ